MTRSLADASLLSISMAVLLLCGGCDGGAEPAGGGMAAPGSDGGPGPGGGGTAAPAIKQIMTKLAKGPNSLTELLGKELNEGQPPWETIQGQSKEYALSAGDLGKYDPPKGSKESWTKLTDAFAESASELDRAAHAKDKDAAKVAHEQLKISCNACHREHRRMGRGMGGPRGFGPPPGGPGGPPPGGPGSGPPPDGASPN